MNKTHLFSLGVVVNETEGRYESHHKETERCHHEGASYSQEDEVTSHLLEVLWVVVQTIPGEKVGRSPHNIDYAETHHTCEN